MTKRDDTGVNCITLSELHATTSLLIFACSETIVNVISGIANYLVKSPDKLSGLTNEVRSSYRNEGEITLSVLKRLPYLGAGVQEGLRLCNPTLFLAHYARLLLTPSRLVGLPRIVTPGGGSVAGNWLPDGICVNVHPPALSRSLDMFHEPELFISGRGLGKYYASARNRHDAVQAFGVGLSSCMGRLLAMAELRLILARLLLRFKLHQADTKAGHLERQLFDVRLQQRTEDSDDR
jgi:cytochrome P450